MRRVDEQPVDPEIADALDAIDATLAGEPVDPRFAELAELALLLSAGRPQIDSSFAGALDARVERRFAPAPASPAAARAKKRPWWRAPAFGSIAATAAVVGVAIVVLAVSGGGGSSGASSGFSSSASTTSSAPAAHSSSGAAGAVKAPSTAGNQLFGRSTSSAARSAPTLYAARGLSNRSGSAGSAAFTPSATAPTPQSSGRKIIQSAQLSLTTPPARIDAVAQEVFDVVGAQNGFVQRSNVTAAGATNSYAQFQLSIPSGNLSQAMAQLSQLKYASVTSRTDATQDVNNQYVGDVRALNDAKALRTALLKQLAQAVTTAQIDSLNQQIHNANATISADQATLNSLNHQIDYSQIEVTINGALIAPAHHKSGGFTLGKAAHDSGRVLTVAAGVALITLAVLVPIGLLVALAWWVVTAVRRRRREQALDLA